MKKAIVFGITGQDGSHLADLLLSKKYVVVGVSRRASTDNTQRIKHILSNESFELIEGDITDAHSVINILKKHEDVDEIYNLAAQSHVAVSFKQPALTWDITGKGGVLTFYSLWLILELMLGSIRLAVARCLERTTTRLTEKSFKTKKLSSYLKARMLSQSVRLII